MGLFMLRVLRENKMGPKFTAVRTWYSGEDVRY